MATVSSLNELLIEELKDIYDAEKQLVKALPKLANAAENPDLKQAFTDHLAETRGHVERLEQVFEELGAPARSRSCKAMAGLVDEGAEMIALKTSAPPLRDAALIGAAQRVEHYEIAAYGTARALAETLGADRVATLLQATLDEEGAADKKLTALSEFVNQQAGANVETDEA